MRLLLDLQTPEVFEKFEKMKETIKSEFTHYWLSEGISRHNVGPVADDPDYHRGMDFLRDLRMCLDINLRPIEVTITSSLPILETELYPDNEWRSYDAMSNVVYPGWRMVQDWLDLLLRLDDIQSPVKVLDDEDIEYLRAQIRKELRVFTIELGDIAETALSNALRIVKARR